MKRLRELASDTDALQFSSRTRNPYRNPNRCDNRNHPRREKGNRHANHPQAPHDGAGALSQGASQRGEQTALVRNDITLAVDLDRDIG